MLVRLDALFEGLLGVALLLAAATGALDGSDFPAPVGTVVLLVAGCGLLLLSGLLRNGRIGLRMLAAGNATTAALGVVWLIGADGWSAAGATIVGVTVAALGSLAAAQAATLRA
jgi:hypothetical protein